MANEFSTAGITVYYKAQAYGTGTIPTSGLTQIAGIKSTPEFNPEPSSHEVTDLADTEYKRYIPGLKDVGGALAFNANLTSAFKTAWAGLVTAATADSVGGAWFEICIPNFESFYFYGMPSPLGVSAFEVDSVAEISAYVTPNYIGGWSTASTKSSG